MHRWEAGILVYCGIIKSMKTPTQAKHSSLIMQNKVFAWIACAIAALLAVPFVAMQFTDTVTWTWFDFALAGTLLFGMGSAFVLVARKIHGHYALLAAAFAVALILIWVELAVGFFTNK